MKFLISWKYGFGLFIVEKLVSFYYGYAIVLVTSGMSKIFTSFDNRYYVWKRICKQSITTLHSFLQVSLHCSLILRRLRIGYASYKAMVHTHFLMNYQILWMALYLEERRSDTLFEMHICFRQFLGIRNLFDYYSCRFYSQRILWQTLST